jgi:hypothetical protein
MEELTYRSGMMRVGNTSENFAEPITNVCARTFRRRMSERPVCSNFPQPANEN